MGRSQRGKTALALGRSRLWLIIQVPIILIAGVRAAHRVEQTPSQDPSFRGGIELVTVDVGVFDKKGSPVPDLSAADFSIIAGGKPRNLLSLEFISTRQPPALRTLLDPDTTTGTAQTVSVKTGRASRSWLFVVDVGQIRAGEGRTVLADLVVFLDELAPADQVGLLVLPTGARHDLSVDRTAVRAALQRVTGASTQLNDCAPTLGEAAAIEAGDSRGGRAHADRTKSLGCQAAMGQTRLTLALRRRSTQLVLDEMVRSAEAMAHLEGRKAIVLLSEGLFMDSEIRDVWRDVVAVAARSSVVVYAVHLGFPLTEAGLKGQTTTTRLLDDQYGFDGMAEAASSAGGRAVRAIASAKPALQLLDTELSGYYLLSFRRDPDDEPGKRIKIVVKMKQPGFDVRFRQSFTPGPRLSK